jgi:hypothetical protein
MSIIKIQKAENGYVIECEVPLKSDSKPSDKMSLCCCPGCEKQYIAKDEAEVCDLIEDLLPLLDTEYTSEEEYDKAFDDATNENSDEEKGEKS